MQLPTSVPVDGEETPLPPAADDTAAEEAVLAALYGDDDLLDDWDDPTDLREAGLPALRLRLDRVTRRLALPTRTAR